ERDLFSWGGIGSQPRIGPRLQGAYGRCSVGAQRALHVVGETRAGILTLTGEVVFEEVADGGTQLRARYATVVSAGVPDDRHLATRFGDLAGVRIGLREPEQRVRHTLYQHRRHGDVLGDRSGGDPAQQLQRLLGGDTVGGHVDV